MSTDRENVLNDFLIRLEPDPLTDEERYSRLRLKLIKFFVWKRCEEPERLADETVVRVINLFNQGEEIRPENPYAYVYAVARVVYLEYVRERIKREPVAPNYPQIEIAESDDQECQAECLLKLSPDKVKLIQMYYEGGDRRETLAQDYGISISVFRLRIYRIKQELTACREECIKRKLSGG